MLLLCLVAILELSAAKAKCVPKAVPEYHSFPKGFQWSTATAAFQIEGATREDGRGPSIWDEYTLKPGKIRDNSTADVASDSFHKFREDVELMKSLGVGPASPRYPFKVTHYRFSFSWSRIFPVGTGKPNPKGVQHYHDVIDSLLENNIQPMVTLYHWDLPLALHDQGGWLNREIVKWFRLYAAFCFNEYGRKVKLWLTLNEPVAQSTLGYCGKGGEHAPGGFKEHCQWAQYLAGHHMLLAHAHAYRAYHGLFKNSSGKIGIANSVTWLEPESKAEEDLTNKAREWTTVWFTHPLFEGDYPTAMRQMLEEASKKEGRTSSRLPRFTAYESQILIGSLDFLGLNYYNTLTVRGLSKEERGLHKGIEYDLDVAGWLSKKDMPVGRKGSWISSHPSGLRAVLNYIRDRYQNPEVFITENGCMDTPGEGLNDITRMRYVREHIAAVSQAIEDGCHVVGYTLWSLIDNFEWSDGYTNLFGINKVDFSVPSRPRTPKASAGLYAEIVRNNSVALIEEIMRQFLRKREAIEQTFPNG